MPNGICILHVHFLGNELIVSITLSKGEDSKRLGRQKCTKHIPLIEAIGISVRSTQ